MMGEESQLTDRLEGGEILLVDKPAGMSSFGVVARVRSRLTREILATTGVKRKVKVGHTGTLDPFATGLLVLLIGKGTKRAGEFLGMDKEYVARCKLGFTSTTGDPEGEISPYASGRARQEPGLSSQADISALLSPSSRMTKSRPEAYGLISPTREQVEKVIAGFVGELVQRPPVFSAVKISGQRAYKLARKGVKVEMPERTVRIELIEILRYEWPELQIRVRCSSGTYIRSLAEDIGDALGVGAYLTALRRTRVGDYGIENAISFDEFV